MRVVSDQMRPATIILVVLSMVVLAVGAFEKVESRWTPGNTHRGRGHKVHQSKLRCGEHVTETTRMVGGTPAELGRFPHVVMIQFEVKLMQKGEAYWSTWYCTGSIIDEKYVLTTVSCLDPQKLFKDVKSPPHNIRVVNVGDVAYGEGTKFHVMSYATHENFTCDRGVVHCTNNIAIIRTAQPINFIIHPTGIAVNRVCLPSAYTNYKDDEKYTIASWSYIAENGKQVQAKRMHYGEVQIHERNSCKVNFEQKPIAEDQLCMVAYVGPCNGEYGTPATRLINGDRWELVGLFSHFPVDICKPGVFPITRVASHIDWINEKMKEGLF